MESVDEHSSSLSEVSTALNNSGVVYSYATMDAAAAANINAELDWTALAASSDLTALTPAAQLAALQSLTDKLKHNKQQQSSSDESPSPTSLAAASATLATALALASALQEQLAAQSRTRLEQQQTFWSAKEAEIKERKNKQQQHTASQLSSPTRGIPSTLSSPIRV